MRQRGTVDKYIWEFELNSSQYGKLPELQFLGYFIRGLKAEIRNRVRTLKLKTHHRAMQISSQMELLDVGEDDEGGGAKNGIYGLSPWQFRAQVATSYAMDWAILLLVIPRSLLNPVWCRNQVWGERDIG